MPDVLVYGKANDFWILTLSLMTLLYLFVIGVYMCVSILLDFLHRKMCHLLLKIVFYFSFLICILLIPFLSYCMNQDFCVVVVRGNILALFPVLWGDLLFLTIGLWAFFLSHCQSLRGFFWELHCESWGSSWK